MAYIKFDGLSKYNEQLEGLARSISGICKCAIYPAAGLVCDAIKNATPADTGDLADSIVITKMQEDNGYIYAKITFAGYDRKGSPNIVKARVLESGRSDQPGRKKVPFVRKAVNASKKAALGIIETELDRQIYELMQKKKGVK